MTKKFQIKFDCENAAFDDGERNHQVAYILTDLAKMVKRGEMRNIGRTLYDINGNSCGHAAYDKE